MPSSTIRPAVEADVPEIRQMIVDLAAYQKEPDAVKVTEERLAEQLFAKNPAVFAHVAEAPAGSGRRLDGFALWFLTFSTWEGEFGIHLEDLYVRAESRGSGAGKALMKSLAATAVERGFKRVEWSVLKWNAPTIAFYDSIGAVPQSEWEAYRLDGETLEAFSK